MPLRLQHPANWGGAAELTPQHAVEEIGEVALGSSEGFGDALGVPAGVGEGVAHRAGEGRRFRDRRRPLLRQPQQVHKDRVLLMRDQAHGVRSLDLNVLLRNEQLMLKDLQLAANVGVVDVLRQAGGDG